MKRTPLERKTPLKSKGTLTRSRQPLKQGKGFAVSVAQREKVRDQDCIVCGRRSDWDGVPVDPAHLVDRSLAPDLDGDPLRVVPICRTCHTAYDEQGFDLSPYLEPRWREEAAHAVRLVGLWQAVNRITNSRWRPE